MTALLLALAFCVAGVAVAVTAAARSHRARSEAELDRNDRLHRLSWAFVIAAVTMLVVGGIHIALVTQ